MSECHFCGCPGATREADVTRPGARRLADTAPCLLCERAPLCGARAPARAPRCRCRIMADLREELRAETPDLGRVGALAEELQATADCAGEGAARFSTRTLPRGSQGTRRA